MPSYQDIESRLQSVEEMLSFLMTNMRMTAVVNTSVLGADGKPQAAKKFEGSLLELYRIAKTEALPVARQSDEEVDGN